MIPPLIVNLLQGAKRGLYTVMCSQLPSELSKACRSASTVISFNLNSEAEARAISPSLRLSGKAQTDYLGGLRDREAVVCKHESHPVPVLTRTMEFRLPKVSDVELDAIMEDQLAWLMEDVELDSQSSERVTPKEPIDASVDRKNHPSDRHEQEEAIANNQGLNRDELRLLHDAVCYPYEGVSERYSRLGISASRGDKLKKNLVRRKLVLEHKAKLSGRGGATTLLQLTESAYELLKVDMPKEHGIGNFLHRFFQHVLMLKLESWGVCEIEAKLPNGKLIDILVTSPGGTLVGVEIEMLVCKHVLTNIERDLQNNLDRLIVAAPSIEVLEGIQKLLQRHQGQYDTSIVELTLVSRLLQKGKGESGEPDADVSS